MAMSAFVASAVVLRFADSAWHSCGATPLLKSEFEESLAMSYATYSQAFSLAGTNEAISFSPLLSVFSLSLDIR